MNRKRGYGWLIATILIFVIMLSGACVKVWNDNILEVRDISHYFNRDYIEYTGGDEASLFFTEYVDTDEYIDIAFYYRNSGSMLCTLYNSWTVFALDVYYEDDKFFEVTERLLPDTDSPVLYDSALKGFMPYNIVKSQPLYQNNAAAFLIDVNNRTVRYCFIYNYPAQDGKHRDVISAVQLSIQLPSNLGNDMAFEYSVKTQTNY